MRQAGYTITPLDHGRYRCDVIGCNRTARVMLERIGEVFLAYCCEPCKRRFIDQGGTFDEVHPVERSL